MPAGYAHYRFGQAVRPLLTGKAAKAAKNCAQLFDVGLQGPDLFFYYNPVFKTKIGSIGHVLHYQSGKALFERSCAMLRNAPTEGKLAYLYGMLAHYSLDSVCHPVVEAAAKQGIATHLELEAELDRTLLELDGKTPAFRQNLGPYFRLTKGECAAVADFYPPATMRNIHTCSANMVHLHRLMAGRTHGLMKKAYSMAGKGGMVLNDRPDERCTKTVEQLISRFDRAAKRYALLAGQIDECLKNGTPLGNEFLPDFMGSI